MKLGLARHDINLEHVADRRLVIPWARNRGHEVVDAYDPLAEVIFTNPRVPFGKILKASRGRPIVFVLRDAYMVSDGRVKDRIRSLAKFTQGERPFTLRPYPALLIEQLDHCDAVVCASLDQRRILEGLTSTPVVSVLDLHDEYGTRRTKSFTSESEVRIFWEGVPSSLKSLEGLAPAFRFLQSEMGKPVLLTILSSQSSHLALDRGIRYPTEWKLRSLRKRSLVRVELVTWSIKNVRKVSESAHFAVVPVERTSPLANLKSENRVLIAWRLGLPVLASDIPSHSRIAENSGADILCRKREDWSEKMLSLAKSDLEWSRNIESGQKYLNQVTDKEVIFRQLDQALVIARGRQ